MFSFHEYLDDGQRTAVSQGLPAGAHCLVVPADGGGYERVTHRAQRWHRAPFMDYASALASAQAWAARVEREASQIIPIHAEATP
jgi:hypothetical protein